MSNWNIRCNILRYFNNYYTALLVHELNPELTLKQFSNFRNNAARLNQEPNKEHLYSEDFVNIRSGRLCLVWIFRPEQIFEEEYVKQMLSEFGLNYEPYVNLCPYVITESLLRAANCRNDRLITSLLDLYRDLHENYISYI